MGLIRPRGSVAQLHQHVNFDLLGMKTCNYCYHFVIPSDFCHYSAHNFCHLY